jgi:quinol monooxygenase YgiN
MAAPGLDPGHAPNRAELDTAQHHGSYRLQSSAQWETALNQGGHPMPSVTRRTIVQGATLGTALAAFASAQAAEAGGSLYVIAELVAKPGNADALRDLLVPFVAKARTEPGCQHYSLLEVQGEPGRFLTFETWTDRSALDAHMTTPHIKELAPKLGPILARPFTQTFLNAVSLG